MWGGEGSARGGCANNLRHLQPSWLSVSGVVARQPVERHVWLLIKILNENATAEMVTGSVRSAALRCHGDSGLDLTMGSRCWCDGNGNGVRGVHGAT